MAAKNKERKGKKQRKKHPKKLKSAHYKVSDGSVSKKRFCPKCGSGVFMAEHGNRDSCGKCSYTEWKSK